MKKTKNAQNKKKGEKRTFRVNEYEDNDIIKYLDKASNGSGFIKEAIRFYIMAIENDMVTSPYLEKEEDRWGHIFGSTNKEQDINPFEDIDVPDDIFKEDAPIMKIDEFDYPENKTTSVLSDNRNIEILELDLDNDEEYDDFDMYGG